MFPLTSARRRMDTVYRFDLAVNRFGGFGGLSSDPPNLFCKIYFTPHSKLPRKVGIKNEFAS